MEHLYISPKAYNITHTLIIFLGYFHLFCEDEEEGGCFNSTPSSFSITISRRYYWILCSHS